MSFYSMMDIFGLVTLYLDLLTSHPVLTKSVTSAVIAVTGNYIAQKIKAHTDNASLNYRSMFSFFIYGLAVIGPVTHHFYAFLEQLVPASSSLVLAKRIAIERLVFAPCLVLVTVVCLEILQGRSRNIVSAVKCGYLPTLRANWKFWTAPQFFNVNYVPLDYRPLFANVVALGWNVYLANLVAKRATVGDDSKTKRT